MKRRDFLLGAAVSAAGVAGLTGQGGTGARSRRTTGRPGRAGPRGRRRPRTGSGREVAPAKLARISLMTLNFNPLSQECGQPEPDADQTLTAFDLPKMYVESYGVPNIEYQHRDDRPV